jgi:hypothetical protein
MPLSAHALALIYYFQMSLVEGDKHLFTSRKMLAVVAYCLLTLHSAIQIALAFASVGE